MVWGMYLFFIRRFADFDHMFPIIYRMINGENNVSVLCQNLDYDIHSDWMVAELEGNHKIWVDYSYKYDNSALRRFLSKHLWRFPKIHRRLYGRKWAKNLLNHFNPKVVIFDVDRKGKYSTELILRTAREMGIRSFMIAHGVSMGVSGQKVDLVDSDFYLFPNTISMGNYDLQGKVCSP